MPSPGIGCGPHLRSPGDTTAVVHVRAYSSWSYTVPFWKHSYPMDKYRLVSEGLVADGTLGHEDLVSPEPVSPEALLVAHTREYVDAVIGGTLDSRAMRRVGLPWSTALVSRSLSVIGGTLLAACAALEEGVAANLGGGTHHAFAGHGAGYCLFNDLVIAVRHLRARGLAERFLVVDLDVHQGDGTAALCRDDPGVFTFSMHGEKNFPARKERSSWDIGLATHTGDDVYLDTLTRSLPSLPERFSPDLILYQAGVDVLAGDRFGKLALTMEGVGERDKCVFEFARTAGLPVVVTLGGGYSPRIDRIVEAHCQTVRIAADVLAGEAPDRLEPRHPSLEEEPWRPMQERTSSER
jgi:acetoin utilization deacetylase AcuC-like enzyme